MEMLIKATQKQTSLTQDIKKNHKKVPPISYLDHPFTFRIKLRKLAHAIYTDYFQKQKLKISLKYFDIFNVFAQNIQCRYTLKPPRRGGSFLTSTHNLCFGAKIRKICKPLHTPFCYIKVGYKGIYMYIMFL